MDQKAPSALLAEANAAGRLAVGAQAVELISDVSRPFVVVVSTPEGVQILSSCDGPFIAIASVLVSNLADRQLVR